MSFILAGLIGDEDTMPFSVLQNRFNDRIEDTTIIFEE